jgi:hypothetical protein
MKKKLMTLVALLGAVSILLTPGCATIGDQPPPTAEEIASVFTPIASWGITKLTTKNPELVYFLPVIGGTVRHFHDSGELDPAVLAMQVRVALQSAGINVLEGDDAAEVRLVAETILSFYRLYARAPGIKLENRPKWLRTILLIIAEGIDAQNL